MKSTRIFLMILLLLGLAAAAGGAPAALAQTPTGQPQDTQLQPDPGTLLDVISAHEHLHTLELLVKAAGLADNLDRHGPFTVFAPTDAAWTSLEAQGYPTDVTLTEILLYHVVNGRYSGPNVANRSALPTLLGHPLSFSVRDNAIRLNDVARVTTTDVAASNGVVHVIEVVMVPPPNSLFASDRGSADQTLRQVLADDGRFTTFLTLAEQVGLTANLESKEGNYTIFAPTDDAFAAVDPVLLDEWLSDPEALKTILSYHVVGDRLSINQIANDDYLPTLEGRPLVVTTDENIQVYLNGHPVLEFNILGAGGVIHVVDTVLTP